MAQSPSDISPSDTDTAAPENKPRAESLRENSLKTAGWAYLVGDAALFAAGVLKGNSVTGEAFTGMTWALGGLGAARYGNPSAEKQLEILSGRLACLGRPKPFVKRWA